MGVISGWTNIENTHGIIEANLSERFDVVLLGPTGVTGREVARYLARRAPEVGLRWAIAGRSRAKIDALLHALPSQPDGVLTADTSAPESIDALAASASVIANLVGPYARHGEAVYEACVRHATHELDLCGEIDWLARMIQRYDGAAVASGARIVPAAGFEALPFDLGMLLAAATACARSGEPVVHVDVAAALASDLSIYRPSDAVSGGTFVSGVEALRRGPGEAFTDPYVLDPPGSKASGRYELWPRRHGATAAWLSPLFPSPFLNPPIAHRTAALLRADGDRTFAARFRYREGTATDSMVPALVAPAAALALATFQLGSSLVARAPDPVRRRLADALLLLGPKPGDGPRPDRLDAWSYRLDIRATTAGGRACDVIVEAVGHPGYKSTATLVGEAALILADRDAPLPARAGLLTPATALGLDVLDRFEHAGARFSVVA
jgi:short subunit dehydrogenase-like uncharacterized protein